MKQKKKQIDSVLVIGIGFFLITLIVAITFCRNNSKRNEANNQTYSEKSSLEDKQQSNGMNAVDLLEKMRFAENLILLDLRNEAFFSHEHILGSINYSPDDVKKGLDFFDKKATYVIIDEFDSTPQQIDLLEFLIKNNFQKVFFLKGGWNGWKKNFNPTISQGDPNSFSDQAKVNYLKKEELKNLLNSKEKIIFLDLRQSHQISENRLKEALEIPLTELEMRYDEIPTGKKIILFSEDGLVSFQGAVKLFDIGKTNIYAFSGTIQDLFDLGL